MAYAKKRQANKVVVYPEIVSVSRPDGDASRWTVREGLAQRGGAWTNFGTHEIRVPLVDDETAKAVRGHELVHTKISPSNAEALETWASEIGLTAEIISSAEEVRVNAVAQKAGYNVDALIDGSEKMSGKRYGEASLNSVKARNEAIISGTALIGTKAFTQFVNGVKAGNPQLASELRELAKEVKKLLRHSYYIASDSETPVFRDGGSEQVGTLPYGFVKTVKDIGQLVSRRLMPEEAQQQYRNSGVEIPAGGMGKFANLVVHKGLLLNKQTKGIIGRKRKPSTTGKRIAYPHRLLTDPEKRIFQSKPRNSGGVVLLDLSGSMSLSVKDIQDMLDVSPGALVAGYSHRKSAPNLPNYWVLAKGGKTVSTLEDVDYGHGNCVDGPALDYTLGLRKGRETFIWVCDGIITDMEDKRYNVGAEVCAEIVRKHNIIVVPTVEEALIALKNPRTAKSNVGGNLGYYLPRRLGGYSDVRSR
jgi:hypothetical protein